MSVYTSPVCPERKFLFCINQHLKSSSSFYAELPRQELLGGKEQEKCLPFFFHLLLCILHCRLMILHWGWWWGCHSCVNVVVRSWLVEQCRLSLTAAATAFAQLLTRCPESNSITGMQWQLAFNLIWWFNFNFCLGWDQYETSPFLEKIRKENR